MKEQLISLETAKLAKEKGFDTPVKTKYVETEEHTLEMGRGGDCVFPYIEPRVLESPVLDKWDTEIAKAPTQSLLQKWLREVHKIDIYVIGYGFGYYSQLNNVSPGNQGEVKYIDRRWNMPPDYKNGEYKTYEEALERGLQEALKLI